MSATLSLAARSLAKSHQSLQQTVWTVSHFTRVRGKEKLCPMISGPGMSRYHRSTAARVALTGRRSSCAVTMSRDEPTVSRAQPARSSSVVSVSSVLPYPDLRVTTFGPAGCSTGARCPPFTGNITMQIEDCWYRRRTSNLGIPYSLRTSRGSSAADFQANPPRPVPRGVLYEESDWCNSRAGTRASAKFPLRKAKGALRCTRGRR